MSETERRLNESLASMAAIYKRESGMLTAVESLGITIKELRQELRDKDYRISELEKKLEAAERRASGAEA